MRNEVKTMSKISHILLKNPVVVPTWTTMRRKDREIEDIIIRVFISIQQMLVRRSI